MNAAFVAWVLLRFSRWALVIATVLYSIEFVTNREQHIQFLSTPHADDRVLDVQSASRSRCLRLI